MFAYGCEKNLSRFLVVAKIVIRIVEIDFSLGGFKSKMTKINRLQSNNWHRQKRIEKKNHLKNVSNQIIPEFKIQFCIFWQTGKGVY